MKTTFTLVLPLALALFGCAADPYGWGNYGNSGWGFSGGERQARNACIDRARETRHRVNGISSVDRVGRDSYRVRLDVRGTADSLICYYDARSGSVDLQWRTAYR